MQSKISLLYNLKMRTIQLFLLVTLLVNLTTSTLIITNKMPKLVDLG